MTSHQFPVGSLLSLFALLIPSQAIAQITPAGDGTGTVITTEGNQINITEGSHSPDGSNQFHSFGEFNVNTDQTANFVTTPNTENVLGRVTGGNPSQIDGTIQVTGGNANLYLMNPAGMVFGENAHLNVPGDFTATTSDRIGFGEGKYFEAEGENNYENLQGNPTEFVIDEGNTGAIVNEGELEVEEGKNLNLVSQSIINDGELIAENGKVTVTAVEGSSLIKISTPGNLLSYEIEPPRDENGNIQPINATDLPELLTGGAPGYIQNEGEIAAGNVEVNARTLVNQGDIATQEDFTSQTEYVVNSGEIAADGGDIDITAETRIIQDAGGEMVTPGGNITLEAETSIVSGVLDTSIDTVGETGGDIGVLGNNPVLLGTEIDASGHSGGGDVLIGGALQGLGETPTAENTFVNSSTEINADATVEGDGGTVVLWADDTTEFHGSITARGGETGGDGGLIEVSGKQGGVFAGEADASAVAGEGGTLLLDPKNITITDGGDTEGSGFSVAQEILNPNPSASDEFGRRVGISGNNVVIGAHLDDTSTTDSGAAYVFAADTGNLGATILNPTPANSDQFGGSVAIDGNNIVIGAPNDDTGAGNAGSAYLFDTSGTLLRTYNNPTPSGSFPEFFGSSVAISGNNIVIGQGGWRSTRS